MFLYSKKIGTKNFFKDGFGKSYCPQVGLVQCDDCQIIALRIPVLHNMENLQTYEFVGQSCFETAQTNECKGLWNPTGRARTFQGKGTYTVHTSHPIWERLRELYGKDRKKRRNSNRGNDLIVTESD